MEQALERRTHSRDIEVLAYVEVDGSTSADIIDSANDGHRDDVMQVATYGTFGPIVSIRFARKEAHLAIALARALRKAQLHVLREDLIRRKPTLHEQICLGLFTHATNGSLLHRLFFSMLHALYVLPARTIAAGRTWLQIDRPIPF